VKALVTRGRELPVRNSRETSKVLVKLSVRELARGQSSSLPGGNSGEITLSQQVFGELGGGFEGVGWVSHAPKLGLSLEAAQIWLVEPKQASVNETPSKA